VSRTESLCWSGGLVTLVLAGGFAAIAAPASVWSRWPLTAPVTLALGLLVVAYLRGARGEPAGRRTAFLGGIATVFLALQSPLAAIAAHSFAIDAVVQMLLRTVAPAVLVLAAPLPALRAGLGLPPAGRRAPLGGALVATLAFVGTAYLWAWPAARDWAVLTTAGRATMAGCFLLSGLLFFRTLFDLRPEPAGPGIGTRLLMVWGAELGNVVLGYFLTYVSVPLYSAYAARGLWFGASGLTNQIYGGQTWWLCDTAAIGLAAMVVIFRWARDEDRLRGRRHWLEHDPATRAARQRAANRRVVFGLLGFVTMILGVVGASVAVYEVGYHRAVGNGKSVSVNQIP
jgi:cytochrome c oxidase assembly factor CtaG